MATGVGGLIVLLGAILSYVAISYGIYLLSKKYEPSLHPAWSWIPVANVYPVVKVSKQPLWWIAVILLAGFVPFIGGLVTLGAIIFIYHKVSERCGRGAGTTACMVFFSVIAFPWLGLSVHKKDTKIAWILGVAALIVSITGSIVVGAGALSGLIKLSKNQDIMDRARAEMMKEIKDNPGMRKQMDEIRAQIEKSNETPPIPSASTSTAE